MIRVEVICLLCVVGIIRNFFICFFSIRICFDGYCDVVESRDVNVCF